MDFNSLMAKMRELDQPVTQSMPATEACGDAPMPMSMPPSMNDQAPPAHPSMSVNLNAQGMDNIESLIKLMTKVNPDMINQPSKMMPMPSMTAMPSLTPPGPSISAIGDLGNLDAGPLKMLPDLDMDEPKGPTDRDSMNDPKDMDSDDMDPDDNDLDKVRGDQDGDGDHDMDDHDVEKDDDKKNEYANEPDEQYKDIDYMVNKLAGGMNGPKGTYPKVAGGDNPMQRVEAVDLRTSIRNELRDRLAEAKSDKFDALKHVKNPTKGEKDAAKDVKRGKYGDRAAILKSAEADGRLKDKA